jgi:hypothetical protein
MSCYGLRNHGKDAYPGIDEGLGGVGRHGGSFPAAPSENVIMCLLIRVRLRESPLATNKLLQM